MRKNSNSIGRSSFEFSKRLLPVFLGLLVFSTVGISIAFAGPFAPGETLDPGCAPGSANCTVLQIAVATSTNKFGIGTTTPWAKFSVAGVASLGTEPLFTVSSSSPTATTTVFHIDYTGNVGIGATTTPGTLLSIQGVANFATATSTFLSTTGGVNLTAGCFAINGVCVGGVGGSGTINSGTTNRLSYYSGGTTLDSANFFAVDTTNSRLGVSTTSPWAKFSITAPSTGSAFHLEGLPNGTARLFSISTSTASATSTAFIVDSNGKVGIGTTTPQSELELKGNFFFSAGAARVLQVATTSGNANSLRIESGNSSDPSAGNGGVLTLNGGSAVVGKGGAVNINGGNHQGSGDTGGAVNVNGGFGGGLGTGGAINILAGDTSGGGFGGALVVAAGDDTSGGTGGATTVRAGDISGSNGIGGALTLRGGNEVMSNGASITLGGGNNGSGGLLTLRSGTGEGGGAVRLFASDSSTTDGQSVSIYAGSGSANGGNVSIYSGSGPTSMGNVILASTTGVTRGLVGIGTSTPYAQLAVEAPQGNWSFLVGSTTGTYFSINPYGKVGIGLTNATLGPLEMASGAYVTAGGVWTSASSRELKENFTSLDANEVLGKINNLSITRWNYKVEPVDNTHIGPVAEEFYEVFSVGGESGKKSISSIDPSGVALIGIQALSKKVEVLENRSYGGSGLSFNSILSSLKDLGADITSGLATFKNIIADTLTVKKLCLEDVCITKIELKELLDKNNIGQSASVSSSSSDSSASSSPASNEANQTDEATTADTEPPVITVVGNNPATVEKGSSYADLGATVTDNVNDNLGIQTEGQNIDTSVVGESTVTYTATDQAGNVGTATRKVKVVEPEVAGFTLTTESSEIIATTTSE